MGIAMLEVRAISNLFCKFEGDQIYRPALISVVVLVAGTILPLSKTSANRGLDLSSVPSSDREHTQGGPYELCTYTRTDPPQYPPCNPTGVQSS